MRWPRWGLSEIGFALPVLASSDLRATLHFLPVLASSDLRATLRFGVPAAARLDDVTVVGELRHHPVEVVLLYPHLVGELRDRDARLLVDQLARLLRPRARSARAAAAALCRTAAAARRRRCGLRGLAVADA